jgi:hypothetical protein
MKNAKRGVIRDLGGKYKVIPNGCSDVDGKIDHPSPRVTLPRNFLYLTGL